MNLIRIKYWKRRNIIHSFQQEGYINIVCMFRVVRSGKWKGIQDIGGEISRKLDPWKNKKTKKDYEQAVVAWCSWLDRGGNGVHKREVFLLDESNFHILYECDITQI